LGTNYFQLSGSCRAECRRAEEGDKVIHFFVLSSSNVKFPVNAPTPTSVQGGSETKGMDFGLLAIKD
jgi:hypothetical protein